MKIFVAGGGGYIGSALIPRLLERGCEVTCADLFWFGDHLPAEVRRITRNVMELAENDLEGCDQVIWLAGHSNDPMAELSPAMNFIHNAAAPAYLGYIARRAGVRRFIYASSCSVYGYAVDRFFTEDDPAVSDYPYGISKLQGERAVLQMVRDDFSVICLRKGTVSGYSPRMRLDLIVNTMFMTAVREERIVVNNPAIWRPVISIRDVESAYLRAVEAGESISGVFNIASGNYTVGEVADRVQETFANALGMTIRLEMKNIRDYRNYKVSTEKARKVLGVRPTHDIEAIVHDLIEHRERFADFDNPAYFNMKVFETLV